jgi:hypothetical protein
MTTLGKILVFLVFIAALAMGGLMLFVSKTTPNWADAVKERDEKIAVLRSMIDADIETRRKLVRDNEKLKQLLDAKLKESTESKADYLKEKKGFEDAVASATDLQEKAQLNARRAAEEVARLQQELAMMDNVRKDRESAIVKLNADLAQARNAEQAAKNDAVTAAARTQSLYEQYKVKEDQLAAMSKKSQPNGVAGTSPRDAGYVSPPPVYVKGRIEDVYESDKSLVKISLGSDSGIRKDQTLEIFRTTPRPEYLGRLVIVEADLHHAIGRVQRQPGMPAVTVQPGDQVASSLRP